MYEHIKKITLTNSLISITGHVFLIYNDDYGGSLGSPSAACIVKVNNMSPSITVCACECIFMS